MTAGLSIHAAIKEWHASPVITTLDSIAAPVTSIQFPTVTVCQEEFHPKDHWAILENILNLVAFECMDDPNILYSEERYSLPLCDETAKVREDFQFLITSVTDFFINQLKNSCWSKQSFKNHCSGI